MLLFGMGWSGGHLHEFIFNEDRFGVPDPDYPDEELQDENKFTLIKALGPFASFTYLYDFGDGWRHFVMVEDIYPSDASLPCPQCIDGQNACPPEDVGGPFGYRDFIEAISKPAHEDHEELLEWCGGHFDPKAFDKEWMNEIFNHKP